MATAVEARFVNEMTDPGSKIRQDTLTSAQWDGLLRRLDDRSVRSGEKYEEVRWKLIKFFQWSSCMAAEDLADATLNRVARKLETEEQDILDVEGFMWGIAKKIRQEARKRENKTISLTDREAQNFASDAAAPIEVLHEKIQRQKELKCLHRCLQSLPADDRALFLRYRAGQGHNAERRMNLAKEFGLTPGALRVRIIRLREKLERCLDRCLATKST